MKKKQLLKEIYPVIFARIQYVLNGYLLFIP